jgi:hypothetical protein
MFGQRIHLGDRDKVVVAAAAEPADLPFHAALFVTAARPGRQKNELKP